MQSIQQKRNVSQCWHYYGNNMCSLRKLDTNTHKTSFLSEITRRTRNCYIRVTLCMIELAYRRTSMHLVFSFIAKPQRQRRIFGLRMVFGEETIIVTSSYPAPRQPILLQTSRCRSPSNSVRISLDSDSGKSISCTVPNHAYTQRDFVPRLYIYIYIPAVFFRHDVGQTLRNVSYCDS